MGIVLLNENGSVKLDDEGNSILAYTNEDFLSLSRAWTGFTRQAKRGNIEGDNKNRIDPMKIEADWRDKFPKTDTTGGYIGDHYPLCQDLPDNFFLKEGATYSLLGDSNMPELVSDPAEFATDSTIKRIALESESFLKHELCNEDDFGDCQFSNSVFLSSSLSYTGIEYDVDTLRVVQVTNDTYYEYVPPPCVNQVFYNDGVKISEFKQEKSAMCGNPRVFEASEACCAAFEDDANRFSEYDGERVSYGTAQERCFLQSAELCNFDKVLGDKTKVSPYFYWTPDDCQIRVKIKSDGRVTLVHHLLNDQDKVMHVNEENENWFKVYWDNNSYPVVENGCDGLCDVYGNTCICETLVTERVVFDVSPASKDQALANLYIGHPKLSLYGIYNSTYDSSTDITTHTINGMIDSKSVFEFTDDKGRHLYLKNSIEKVYLRGIDTDGIMGYSFRNSQLKTPLSL